MENSVHRLGWLSIAFSIFDLMKLLVLMLQFFSRSMVYSKNVAHMYRGKNFKKIGVSSEIFFSYRLTRPTRISKPELRTMEGKHLSS